MAAAHLSKKGKHILVVDLDLEAPCRNLILDQRNLPRYGTLDWFVENGLQPLEEQFLANLVGTSLLGSDLGQIDVAPAVGSLAHRYSANVIAKLSRAYVEDVDGDGNTKSFLQQTQDLIRSLTNRRQYDAVLVDAELV